jgi:uncharacterized protein
MFFKRKLYDKLLDWKNRSQGRSALLIEGARRVGKSSLVREFGTHEYKTCAVIDFFRISKPVRRVFEEDCDDIAVFLKRLSAVLGVPFHARETLIVFDEVQCYPRARGLIKYLVEDGRYDYIETGSLVSIRQNVEGIVIPSEEHSVRLNPMDFEEFLWALGDETTTPYLRECFDARRPLGGGVFEKTMRLWRTYLLVGGMPQSVAEFVASRDFARADEVKREILSLYRKDIAKAEAKDVQKITAIFDELPNQLSRPGGSRTYRLSELDKAARMREYEDAFRWLEDAHIVMTCANATDPTTVSLTQSQDHTTFKAFLCDTGLLVTHTFWNSGFSGNAFYEAVLDDDLSINEGMLVENMVAQMMKVSRERLFYYSRSDPRDRANRMEIDFLSVRDRQVCPVEVKSSQSHAHASLDKFVRKFAGRLGTPVVLCPRDVATAGGVQYLPPPMAMFV